MGAAALQGLGISRSQVSWNTAPGEPAVLWVSQSHRTVGFDGGRASEQHSWGQLYTVSCHPCSLQQAYREEKRSLWLLHAQIWHQHKCTVLWVDVRVNFPHIGLQRLSWRCDPEVVEWLGSPGWAGLLLAKHPKCILPISPKPKNRQLVHRIFMVTTRPSSYPFLCDQCNCFRGSMPIAIAVPPPVAAEQCCNRARRLRKQEFLDEAGEFYGQAHPPPRLHQP